MAKTRLRKRERSAVVWVDVLRPHQGEWVAFRHVDLIEALTRIARREWTALWFENGRLAGVHLVPPLTRTTDLVRIRCGSVECRRSWIQNAQKRPHEPRTRPVHVEPSRLLLDFYAADLLTTAKRVTPDLALRKIALGEWKAVWYENGELAGVAEAG